MTGTGDNQALVVVALDASEPGDFAIELAGTLAGTGAPELLGLFVENSLLLEHASSRRAREILLTGAEHVLDRAALERQLRSQAERARTRFEAASARLGLRHRFEVTRGDIVAEPIRRAAAAEALVIAIGSTLAATSAAAAGFLQQALAARLPLLLLAREGWQRGQCVAVIVDDPAAADAALDAAARIAKASRSPLTVLLAVAAGTDKTALVRTVESALRNRGIERSDFILLGGTALPAVAQAASACRARLLVAPSPADPAETKALGEFLRRFPGALLLVGR